MDAIKYLLLFFLHIMEEDILNYSPTFMFRGTPCRGLSISGPRVKLLTSKTLKILLQCRPLIS